MVSLTLFICVAVHDMLYPVRFLGVSSEGAILQAIHAICCISTVEETILACHAGAIQEDDTPL